MDFIIKVVLRCATGRLPGEPTLPGQSALLAHSTIVSGLSLSRQADKVLSVAMLEHHGNTVQRLNVTMLYDPALAH